MSNKYRFQLYKELHQKMPAMYAEAKKFADDIGITPEMRGKVGHDADGQHPADCLRREHLHLARPRHARRRW